MLLHERLQLADKLDVPTAREVLIDSLVEECEAKLLQAGDLALGEALVGELRERRAPPERERLVQPPLFLQAPETFEIELVGLDAQQIARRLRL